MYFSQIFFKPPEGGGPKPAHQDNFYFGPTDIEGVATAWIALDDATLENGCLYFGDGTNLGPVYSHFAPEGEPFNLQLPATVLDKQPMTPAPVRKGGVSFHHGNTFHQSGPNHSSAWRRACALHYVRNDVEFAHARPALRQRPQAAHHLTRPPFFKTHHDGDDMRTAHRPPAARRRPARRLGRHAPSPRTGSRPGRST